MGNGNPNYERTHQELWFIRFFVHHNTLVIAAFADMRMHPDNVMKAVIGKNK